jgi:hypothetical protein
MTAKPVPTAKHTALGRLIVVGFRFTVVVT